MCRSPLVHVGRRAHRERSRGGRLARHGRVPGPGGLGSKPPASRGAGLRPPPLALRRARRRRGLLQAVASALADERLAGPCASLRCPARLGGSPRGARTSPSVGVGFFEQSLAGGGRRVHRSRPPGGARRGSRQAGRGGGPSSAGRGGGALGRGRCLARLMKTYVPTANGIVKSFSALQKNSWPKLEKNPQRYSHFWGNTKVFANPWSCHSCMPR